MAFDLGELAAFIDVDDSGFEQGLNRAEGKFDRFGGRLKTAAKVGGAVVGAALGAGVVRSVNVGGVHDKLAAQLRLTETESARVGAIAGSLYADAYGESVGEVDQALRGVIAQLGGLGDVSDAELSRAGKKALDLARILDTDVTRVVQVAGQAVEQGLAKDFDQAFDQIAAASAETMPGVTDEVIDASDEYAQFFSQLGFEGDRAFGLLAQASRKGQYGVDKAGDSIKEFTIRSTDMSTASQEAYEAIGLDAETMADKILSGGEDAEEAFDKIVSGLLGIESPSKRANSAIALFGAPIEDLSTRDIPDFLRSLTDTETVLGDVEGAADEMGGTLRDNAQTNLTAFKRSVQSNVVSFLGRHVVPAISTVAATATDKLGPAWNDVTGWLADHKDDAQAYIDPIVDAAGRLATEAGELWDSFTEGEGPLTMAGELLMQAGQGALFLGEQVGPAIDLVADLVGWFADLPGPVQAAVLAFAGLQLARGHLIDLATVTRTRLAGGLRNVNDLADTARLRFMYMGDAAKGAASGGVASLAGAVGRGAGSGLSKALLGLTAIMGGPMGLAITGVSLALGFLASKHAEAKQAAAEQEAAEDELASTLDQQTGAITRETEKLIAKRAAEEGVLDVARELGIAEQDVTQAALGNADAQQRVADALDRAARAAAGDIWDEYGDTLSGAGVSQDTLTEAILGSDDALARIRNSGARGAELALSNAASAARNASGDWDELTGFVDANRAAMENAAQEILDTQDAISDSDPTTRQLADAMSVLSDETADADSKARALNDSLVILAGGTLDLEEAEARANETIRQVSDALDQATEAADGNTDALLNAEGQIDTTTDAGKRLFDATNDAREAMAGQAQAAYETARANGKDAKGGLDAAREASASVREDFVKTWTQTLGNKEAAEQLADSYGLLPDEVVTALEASDNASSKVNNVEDKLNGYDDSEFIAYLKANAHVSQAERDLNDTARNRTSTITVNVNRPKGYADGGIEYPMADGAARTAQIVPAGSNILWGEPETGGEAYIPFAESKRDRSMRILAEVADRFGQALVPQQPDLAPITVTAPPSRAGGRRDDDSGESGQVVHHHHYHLDGAAAARLASSYAVEVDKTRRRSEAVYSDATT